MEAAASGVVLLTSVPLSALFIADGLAGHRVGEVSAGLVIAALVGIPLLVADLRARLRRASGLEGEGPVEE